MARRAFALLGLCLIATAHADTPDPAAQTLTEAQARTLIDSLLVASPYKLGDAARNGHIRYRLKFGDGDIPLLPETGEQHVSANASGVEVDICGDCGREAAPTEAQLQRYRAPNRWVESDDPRIRAFARRHGRGTSVHRRMLGLRDAVRAHMNGPIDFRRYDSAATALTSRSGDCTEVALLLAATARTQGIPARIVYGIAYSSRFTGQSHVFSPHAWVQAWDGHGWRSYDAGLERFDAGHIALAVGDGSFDELAPTTRTIARVRIADAVGILPAGAHPGPTSVSP